MRYAEHDTNHASTLSARIGVLFGALLVVGLLLTTPASASLEQVGTFAESGEAQRLSGASGLAVNTTGAGGVPAGTVYAVAADVYPRNFVSRYSPKGEFREAWGWAVSNPHLSPPQFERCGPDGEPAHPICHTESAGAGEDLSRLSSPYGVAVDQTTGYVYVLNTPVTPNVNTPEVVREHNLIQVFSADGSQLIAAFGDYGKVSIQDIEESPEKIHRSLLGGIAVDDSGTVYVSDEALVEGGARSENRIMVFKPQSPGDYEHYAYAGRANDIAISHDGINYLPFSLALDNAGNLYAQGGESTVYRFSTAEPDAPTCEYEVAGGGMQALTVDPASGEVFYYRYKDKKIYQLSACDAQGDFELKAVFTPLPKAKASGNFALAFNPSLAWEATRPAGILYAADGYSESAGTIPGTRHGLLDVFAPAEVRFPVVDSQNVSSVTSTTATLSAQINPNGSSTRYAFQYLTKAAYEANEPADRFASASEAPLGGTTLGSGQSALSAAASLVGLAPDTEYRYRVIATSHCEPDHEDNVCEVTGEDATFHTFPVEAPGLSDNRAYELVSPAQKHGGEVFPTELDSGGGCACRPGGLAPRFPMQSSPDGEAVVYEGFPFSSTEGASVFNEYLSRRTVSGWQTTTLAPSMMTGSTTGYEAFNPELSQGILSQRAPSLTAEAPSEYPNLYTQPTANLSSLTPLLGSEPPNRPAKSFALDYAGASDDLSHQFFSANDALTGETPFAPEAVDGGAGIHEENLYESVDGQLRLVNVLPGNTETVPGANFGGREARFTDLPHSISADGSRIFWSDGSRQVYVRINGESTTAIPDPVGFVTASEDGSQVLLNSGHIYDLETEETTDLTEGKGGFEGIAGQSDDLFHIYFVDTAVLTGEEENDQGAKAQAGKDNLYAWHEGQSSFVAAPTNPSDWEASPVFRTAEASPNGRWLAFLSSAPLTGYDNAGNCYYGLNKESRPCAEAFLYDSATGKLLCASCNPSGIRPLGPTSFTLFEGGEALSQPRYLTDSGRLYFDTADSLVPSDTNAGSNEDASSFPTSANLYTDTYQYEPEGVGTCKRDGGCVSLISNGHESDYSNFLAMDETGKSVFFTTRDQLVLKDRDDLVDLYVAREGGGIGAETEATKPSCQGEACVPAIVPPNDPTPGSSSFEGVGNVDEKKAAKKHKKKRKHAKKHKTHKRSHGRAANHNRGGGK